MRGRVLIHSTQKRPTHRAQGVTMSQRIQSLTLPIPGLATTTGFVNVYQSHGGHIELGNKMFRQRVNAENKGNAYVGPLEYVKTIEVTTSVTIE